MLPHHTAWLRNHPDRTEEWLRQVLADGFQIHHLDCNHENNAPENLVLIDGDDHMRMHDIPVRRSNLVGRPGEARRPQRRLRSRLRAAEELLRQGGWVI